MNFAPSYTNLCRRAMNKHENPYSSPSVDADRRDSKRSVVKFVLVVPLAIMGTSMVFGPMISIVGELTDAKDTPPSKLFGYTLFIVAGLFWIFSARSLWLRRWWFALPFFALGWLLGGIANRFVT